MKSIRGGFRAAVLAGAVASVMVFATGAKAQNQNSQGQNGNSNSNDNTWPYAGTGRFPVLAVVGDIACQPGEVENGVVVEPTGEANHELCSNPKAPYTGTSL